MSNNPATRYFATGVAAVVLTFGAYLVGKSNTDPAAAGTNASQTVRGAAPQGGQALQGGRVPPGLGTAVTGDTAKKVQAAATARYPGTVERVMKLQDGSYVAHVITSSGERHVLVSKDFRVTGSRQGGPGLPPGSTQQQPQSAPGAAGSQS